MMITSSTTTLTAEMQDKRHGEDQDTADARNAHAIDVGDNDGGGDNLNGEAQNENDRLGQNMNKQREIPPAALSSATSTATSTSTDTDVDTDTASRTLIRHVLLQQLVAEAPRVLIGSAALLVSALCNQALPRCMARLIDLQQQQQQHQQSSQATLYGHLAVVVLGGGLASWVRTSTIRTAQEHMAARWREQGFANLLLLSRLHHPHQIPTAEQPRQQLDQQQQQQQTPSSSLASPSSSSSTERPQIKETTPQELSPGTVAMVLQDDVQRMAQALTNSWTNALRSASSVVLSSIQMLYLNPALLIYSASVIPAVGYVAMHMRRHVRRQQLYHAAAMTQASRFVEERIQHTALVVLSHREDDEIATYSDMQQEAVQQATIMALTEGAMMAFLFVATSTALLSVIHAGGRAVQQNRMTAGQLTSFATYSFLLGLGTSGLVKAAAELSQGWQAAQRYVQCCGAAIHRDNLQLPQADQHVTRLSVEDVSCLVMHHVTFAYPHQNGSCSNTTPSRQVLQGLTLQLRRGQVVALVGPNGSGKSTAANILSGLYRPSSGQVQVVLSSNNNHDDDDPINAVQKPQTTKSMQDGVSSSFSSCCLHQLDRDTRKRLVQIIPQVPALLDVSVLENVRYGQPTATEQEVLAVLQQVRYFNNSSNYNNNSSNNLEHNNSSDKAINYNNKRNDDDDDDDGNGDDGYSNNNDAVLLLQLQQRVGWNGSHLSGGQKQRLALARALLSDPAFLILDEPATALDADGVSALQQLLFVSATTTISSSSSSQGSSNGDPRRHRHPGQDGDGSERQVQPSIEDNTISDGIIGGGSIAHQQQGRRRSDRGILLITHQAKALTMVDYIYVTEQGQIVEEGTLDQLRSNPHSALCRIMPEVLMLS